jgi:purine-nucleoside phosphorylase
MTDRLPSFFDLAKHGIGPDDVVRAYLGCSPSHVCRAAVIMPVWGAAVFRDHVESTVPVLEGRTRGVWRVAYRGEEFSLIRSGMSAAFAGDIVLALGCTPCQTLLFSGSVGGLLPSMKIGDLLLAEGSVCGEGFSRYLEPEVTPRDCFLETASPDAALTLHLRRVAQEAAREHALALHSGAVVSVDSILAQFFRLGYFAQEHGCIGVEMETSATFKAARLVGIRAAALLQVSDVIPTGKSLFSGRTDEEMDERRRIRSEVLTKVLLDALVAAKG